MTAVDEEDGVEKRGILKKKKWSYDAGFYEDYAPGKRKSLPSSD